MLIGSTNKIVIKSARMKHKPEYCSHCATQAKRPRRVVFADKKVCITNTTGLGQPWRSNSRSNSCRERHFVRLNSGRMNLGRENGKSHTEILQTVMRSSKMTVNYALKFVQLISRLLVPGRILKLPIKVAALENKTNAWLLSDIKTILLRSKFIFAPYSVAPFPDQDNHLVVFFLVLLFFLQALEYRHHLMKAWLIILWLKQLSSATEYFITWSDSSAPNSNHSILCPSSAERFSFSNGKYHKTCDRPLPSLRASVRVNPFS